MAYLITGSLQRSNPVWGWQGRALRQRTELYPWPLALALIIMLLSLTGARLRGRRER